MNRRNILIGLGIVAAGAAAGGGYWLTSAQKAPAPVSGNASGGSGAASVAQAAGGGAMPLFDDDRILGDAAAPVTFIEYASLTCGHCASFHNNTLPEVKKNWIDSGRARLVYRHYPLDQLALRAAALANCIEGPAFFGFLDVLFKNQEKWRDSEDPIKGLQQYAALAGLDSGAAGVCIDNDAVITRILEKQTDGRDTYNVASTPTFVINGTAYPGARAYDEFNGLLESAAAKAG